MAIKLYYDLASPSSRAVELTLKTLDIAYEIIDLDLSKGEQIREEFLKINPQHTVPVIVDEDGFVLTDSHAINAYLVGKYAEDDKLYPKNLKARSIVDSRMYFDCGTLFQCLKNVCTAYFLQGITNLNRQLEIRFVDAYETLEKYLSSTQYIAADHITIADFSILTSLVNAELYVPIKETKYPKLSAYLQQGYAAIPLLEEHRQPVLESMKKHYKNYNF